jgi:hypothetical protein
MKRSSKGRSVAAARGIILEFAVTNRQCLKLRIQACGAVFSYSGVDKTTVKLDVEADAYKPARPHHTGVTLIFPLADEQFHVKIRLGIKSMPR